MMLYVHLGKVMDVKPPHCCVSLKLENKLLIKIYKWLLLIDLSKAFDCLPHDILLISKLTVYGLSRNSIFIHSSYSTDRCQEVNLHGVFISLVGIKKGVPQGFIHGPLY